MSHTVSREQFTNFLDLIQLQGFVKNNEILMESTKDYIRTYACSLDKSFALKGIYKGSFPERAEVGISSLDSFIKYIKLMDEDFEIDFKTNKILIKSKKVQVSTVLKNRAYFENANPDNCRLLNSEKFEAKLKSLESQFHFLLTQDIMTEIVKKFKAIQGDKSTPCEKVIFSFKNKKLILKLDNTKAETLLLAEFDVESLDKLKPEEEFNVNMTKKLVDLFSCITQPLDCFVSLTAEKKIMVLKVKDENFEVSYLLACQEVED